MKSKNIVIFPWSSWDTNISYNYSLVLAKKYNIFFATSDIISYKILKNKNISVNFFDNFDKWNNNKYEIKILEYEAKYLLPFWVTLENLKFSDRFYFNKTNDYFLKTSCNLFKEIESFIMKNDIDISISQISSSLPIRIMSFIMRTLWKNHIYNDSYPLEKDKFIISDIDESWNSNIINDSWSNFDEEKLDKNIIDEYIWCFVKKNEMIYKPIIPKVFSIRNFKSLFKLIKEVEWKWHSSLLNRIVFHLKQVFQWKLSKLLIKYDKVEINEKYIFFPIHVSEDAQILVRNQHYFDQMNLMEVIARSLPLDYKLYVKEHPSNIWWIWLKGLNRIRKNHKISLINPLENSQNLINNSRWVLVINWSAWLEALARKKPIIVLWEAFYAKWDNVYKLKNLEDIYKSINWLENHIFNEKDFYRLFSSIINWIVKWNCFDYNDVWRNTDDIWNSFLGYFKKL